jgi:hypothetical protein
MQSGPLVAIAFSARRSRFHISCGWWPSS